MHDSHVDLACSVGDLSSVLGITIRILLRLRWYVSLRRVKDKSLILMLQACSLIIVHSLHLRGFLVKLRVILRITTSHVRLLLHIWLLYGIRNDWGSTIGKILVSSEVFCLLPLQFVYSITLQYKAKDDDKESYTEYYRNYSPGWD